MIIQIDRHTCSDIAMHFCVRAKLCCFPEGYGGRETGVSEGSPGGKVRGRSWSTATARSLSARVPPFKLPGRSMAVNALTCRKAQLPHIGPVLGVPVGLLPFACASQARKRRLPRRELIGIKTRATDPSAIVEAASTSIAGASSTSLVSPILGASVMYFCQSQFS